jgi:hypothetical protein
MEANSWKFTHSGNTQTAFYIQNGTGNVGIGTSSPGKALHLSGSDGDYGIRIEQTASAAGKAALVFTKNPDREWGFGTLATTENSNFVIRDFTAGQHRFIIDSNGNVGIGTTDLGSYKLYVNGAACDSDGTLSACSSDIRLKENIKPIENALDYLADFKPVEFNFIGEKKKRIGLIAQDVKKVHPELIVEMPDGYITYEDPGFKYLLIRAVQELKAEVDKLKEENGALKQKLAEMEKE